MKRVRGEGGGMKGRKRNNSQRKRKERKGRMGGRMSPSDRRKPCVEKT